MRVFALFSVVFLSACSNFNLSTSESHIEQQLKPTHDAVNKKMFCANEWFQYIEGQLKTSDQHHHGPDIGSTEWQSVIEFKLGVSKDASLPPKSTSQWCEYIQQALNKSRSLPGLNCEDKEINEIEQLICNQPALAKLDGTLNEIFKSVSAKRQHHQNSDLKNEQRAWIKKRDACLKNELVLACVYSRYHFRIAELQVRHQLVEGLEPIFYVCDDRPSDEIIVTFYPTSPASLMAERSGQTAFMIIQESEEGTLYRSADEQFWEHQDIAKVDWGKGSPEMKCVKMH